MGTWFNNDELFIEYGTTKAVANTGGDYLSYGELREIELTIDLTTLTTSPVIQDNNTFIGNGSFFIEQVEVVADVAATGGTSFSVGLIGLDRSTVDSNTKFVNALALATHDAAGEKTVLTVGSTGAGSGIGTVPTNPGYITALCAGTYTAGKVKVRIKYRGFGNITK